MYDHLHTPNGHFLYLSQTQDAEGEHCGDCGRSVYPDTQPHNHAMDCPVYLPHPDSIAGQASIGQG